MISRDCRNIHIDIIYRKKRTPLDYRTKMNHEKIKMHPKTEAVAQNKFICSICLNKRPINVNRNEDCNKRAAKSCPICQCGTDTIAFEENGTPFFHHVKTKCAQTSQTDIAHGITLLNEVLSVFQNKKKLEADKTAIFKDKSVNTDVSLNKRRNLVVSEIFQYSIEDSKSNNEGKFTVLNVERPCKMNRTIPLSKHKSSSIPQMKLDELKNSLKEKTKSKDAIEEVNRMFATVRKIDDHDESNRPVTRIGPRLLPVVKTSKYEEDREIKRSEEYKMSSGDSGLEMRTNQHRIDLCKSEKCAECVYWCCHYQRYKSGVCENCQKLNLSHMRDERI